MRFATAIALWAMVSSSRLLAGDPDTVMIFYVTGGQGHISAARAIKEGIEAEDARTGRRTKIVMVDILDFMPNPLVRRFGPQAWGQMNRVFPALRGKIWDKAMEAAEAKTDVSQLRSQYYDLPELARFINAHNPGVIVSTFMHSSRALIRLRDEGRIEKDVPLAWAITDYTDQHNYMKLISKRMDRTFLPAGGMLPSWRAGGVPAEKVAVSGMPVNEAVKQPLAPAARDAFIRDRLSLDPAERIVALTAGSEGAADYVAMAKQIAAHGPFPIQIVAMTGKNAEEKRRLDALAATPEFRDGKVRLRAFGLVDNATMINLFHVSAAVVSSPGGLTPAEIFNIGRPLVVRDYVGANERDNAEYFARNRLALVNREAGKLGEEIHRLLTDEPLRRELAEAQRRFRDDFDLSKIVDYIGERRAEVRATHDPKKDAATPAHVPLGLDGGVKVQGARAALRQLESLAPAEVEVFLHASAATGHGFFDHLLENPFGHLAIRIGDKVYSVNQRAKPGQDATFLSRLDAEEYLYGVEPTSPSHRVGSNLGFAYSGETLSLRLRGVDPEAIRKMLEKTEAIDAAWRAGTLSYHATRTNCATVVEDILKAGGFVPPRRAKPSELPSFPLSVFEDYLQYFARRGAGPALETARYDQVADAKTRHRFGRFPVSIGKPFAMVANWIAQLTGLPYRHRIERLRHRFLVANGPAGVELRERVKHGCAGVRAL